MRCFWVCVCAVCGLLPCYSRAAVKAALVIAERVRRGQVTAEEACDKDMTDALIDELEKACEGNLCDLGVIARTTHTHTHTHTHTLSLSLSLFLIFFLSFLRVHRGMQCFDYTYQLVFSLFAVAGISTHKRNEIFIAQLVPIFMPHFPFDWV
jgi:hypothetical protein